MWPNTCLLIRKFLTAHTWCLFLTDLMAYRSSSLSAIAFYLVKKKKKSCTSANLFLRTLRGISQGALKAEFNSALCMHPCTASGRQVLTCVLWLGDRNAYSFPFPIWWKTLAFPALFRKTGTTRGLRWDSHLCFSIGQGFMNCLHKGVIL